MPTLTACSERLRARKRTRHWPDDAAEPAGPPAPTIRRPANGAAGLIRSKAGQYGLMRDIGSPKELAGAYKADIDRSTQDYPVAHGAGPMATGMAASMAVPGTKLAQGLVQGAQSAAAEYADSRDPWRTAASGAMGFESGVVGTAIGNSLARRFGVVDPVKNSIVRGGMSPAEMRGPTPDITKRGGKALELLEELSQGAPFRSRATWCAEHGRCRHAGPSPDITARGGRRIEALEELAELGVGPTRSRARWCAAACRQRRCRGQAPTSRSAARVGSTSATCSSPKRLR